MNYDRISLLLGLANLANTYYQCYSIRKQMQQDQNEISATLKIHSEQLTTIQTLITSFPTV